MNPVLLKPGSDRSSQVVVRGRPLTDITATGFADLHPQLRAATLQAYDELAERYDVVVCEGAGSAAEINLRATDLANLGLADARDLPVVVVADVDRGGVFAALFGTRHRARRPRPPGDRDLRRVPDARPQAGRRRRVRRRAGRGFRLDLAALRSLVVDGPPAGLPLLAPGAG